MDNAFFNIFKSGFSIHFQKIISLTHTVQHLSNIRDIIYYNIRCKIRYVEF